LTEGTRLDLLHEVFDNGEVDVGLQQAEPHFPDRFFDIGLGHRAVAADLFDDLAEAIFQVFEHGCLSVSVPDHSGSAQ